MGVSLRQRLMVDCLLQKAGGVSIRDLAKAVDTSERTVFRELPLLVKLLHEYGVTLQKHSGGGMSLNGSKPQLARLCKDLAREPVAGIKPADRQAWLACRLLASYEPVKLFALAVELQVTMPTVSSDLDALEKWLVSYSLQLSRKPSVGIGILGDEADRRNAISDLLFAQFDEVTLHRWFHKSVADADASRDNVLLRPAAMLLREQSCRQAGELLLAVEAQIPLRQTAVSWLELAIQVALILERLPKFGCCKELNIALDLVEYQLEQQFIDRLLPLLAEAIGCPVPTAEATRLLLFLCAAKREESSAQDVAATDAALLRQIYLFLDLCDQRLETGNALQNDQVLVEGLVAHLKPALHRVTYRLPIRNPLLADIRNNYADLFQAVQNAALEAFRVDKIPDEEIGSLVLHIGSAVERQCYQPKRALVICSSGIGTSRMLASRLRTEFPELEIIDQLAWIEASDQRLDAYDMILSSIPLDLPPGTYLMISPLLQPEDVQKIRAFLYQKHAGKLAKLKLDHKKAKNV